MAASLDGSPPHRKKFTGLTADMANYEKFNQTFSTMVQLYNFFNYIVVVVVELEIFESLEINICLLKHLEISCIRQK